MPPFLGQGMCSGIRDALNLSWKFDMILAEKRTADILDTYQSEREDHVRAVIVKGIELGRVQTMRDPDAAAIRDADLIAKRLARTRPEKIRFPSLGDGEFGSGSGAQTLMIQGFGRNLGRRDRFDALFGYGPMVLARPGAAELIDRQRRDALDRAGIRLIMIDAPDGADSFLDEDGVYEGWFVEQGCSVAAVRPDFHVWGTAPADRLAIGNLVRDFIAFVTAESETRPQRTQRHAIGI